MSNQKKRARWDGVDEKIGAKMCYKLVDDESGKIVCRSVIQSATELGTANLWIDPIERYHLMPYTVQNQMLCLMK